MREAGQGVRDLATFEATPFSRYLVGLRQPGSPILKRPAKILIAVANPEDLAEKGLSTRGEAIVGDPAVRLVMDR